MSQFVVPSVHAHGCGRSVEQKIETQESIGPNGRGPVARVAPQVG